MTWKNAILAGALAAGLSLSFVPSASADPRWNDNHHRRWQHHERGDGGYRRYDRHHRHDHDRYRHSRHRRHNHGYYRDWNRARRDRWFDNRRSDRGWYYRGGAYRDFDRYSYRPYSRFWTYR